MIPAKIQFSKEETDLLSRASWLLAKNRILGKIEHFLETLGQELRDQLDREFPESLKVFLHQPPKVSRGEHYQGLPYRVLDYPRHFQAQEIFAWRTLFWWGQFFSVTLHLRGPHLMPEANRMVEKLLSRTGIPVRISLEGNEWDHDAREAPLLTSASAEAWVPQISHAPFCKLTVLFALEDFENLGEKIRACYELFSAALREA